MKTKNALLAVGLGMSVLVPCGAQADPAAPNAADPSSTNPPDPAVATATTPEAQSAASTDVAATDAEVEAPSDDVPASAGDAEIVETVAVAQPSEESAEPEQRSSRSRMVEEIVVTAQKREENVRDVPISIAAFSAEKLAAAGVETTNDLQYVTPGLSYTGIAGFSLVYLRGIGTSAFISSFDPSVATYVDGIYVPAQQGSVTELGGIERVEVLKGPQGTLFGRNSTGGAISVTTRSPTFDPEASAEIEAGNFGSQKIKAYANIPMTSTIAMNVAALYSTVESYYDLVDDPSPANPPQTFTLHDDFTKAARGKILWEPSDRFNLTLTGFWSRQAGSTGVLAPMKKPSRAGELLGVTANGDYEVNQNTYPASAILNTALYSNAVWSFDWLDVKALYGYQSIVTDNLAYDFDGSQADIAAFTTPNAPNRLNTAELQFVSNDTSWGADWLKWAAGLYHLHQNAGYDPLDIRVAARSVDLTPNGLALGGLPAPLADLLNLAGLPLVGPLVEQAGIRVLIHGLLRTDSYSGYVQTTMDFTDWVGLTLGGRYTREDRFLTESDVGLPGYERQIVYDLPKVTQSNFAPKASLNFRLGDDTLAYVIGSRGFQSGSYNIVSIYTPPDYVKPAKATSYEIGVKTVLFDRNLQLNAAIFRTDIKDLQEQYVSLLAGGAVRVENAASARSQGAEFDALVTPFYSWNPDFVITAAASYLDSRYQKYPNASGFDPETGLISQNLDFSGNRIPRSAKWSGSLGMSQTIGLDNGSVELGLDGYYSSGLFFTNQNLEAARQRKYTLLNARASWLFDPWRMRITAFGANLTDKKYEAASSTLDFGTTVTLALPRTYGLRLQWDLN